MVNKKKWYGIWHYKNEYRRVQLIMNGRVIIRLTSGFNIKTH